MRETQYLTLLILALLAAIMLAGGNSAIVGALLSLSVSQIYFMRRSKAELTTVSVIDALRNFARLQINLAAGERLSRRKVLPSFHHTEVDDIPTIISARSTRKNQQFILITIRDNGMNFPARSGIVAVGLAGQDRVPLFYDPIGFGLFIVYLERPFSEIDFILNDSASNCRQQKVYFDHEPS